MLDFLVISAPRSGTNHFCERLTSAPGVIAHMEIFHLSNIYLSVDIDASEDHARDRRVSDRFAQRWDARSRDSDPLGFLAALKAETPGLIVGAKMFPFQAPDVFGWILTDPAVRKIILERENSLAAYASDLAAKAMNRYTVRGRSAPIPPKVVFDAGAFDDFIAIRSAWFEQARTYLKANQHKVHELRYEDSLGDDVVATTLAFLGAPAMAARTPASRNLKTGQRDVVSRFANSADVLVRLRQLGKLGWAVDQSAAIAQLDPKDSRGPRPPPQDGTGEAAEAVNEGGRILAHHRQREG